MVATSQNFFTVNRIFIQYDNSISHVVPKTLFSQSKNCQIFWFMDYAQNLNFKEDDGTFLILPSFVLFDMKSLKHENVTENNGH